LLVLATESRKGILMGYMFIYSKEIVDNQDSLIEAKSYTNQFVGKAVMDRSQLVDICMINLERNEE
jgi:hypothetical protein